MRPALRARLWGLLAASALAPGTWALGCRPAEVAQVWTSTVTTTRAEHGWAVNYPKQRKLFFLHGLWWVFYADGDALYRTSPDGLTWSEPTLVETDSVYGHRVGYAWDGRFLHAAHARAYGSDDVTWRRGEPAPDGTVTWGPTEVAFALEDGEDAMYPAVVVDSDGHPWVSFLRFVGALEDGPWDLVVTHSSSEGERWETAAGFPFLLVDDNRTAFPQTVGAALAGGGVYWVYNRELDTPYVGRLYTGLGWTDEEQVGDRPSSHGLFQALADGDTVHVVYGAGGNFYRRREGAGWSPAEAVGAGSGHSVLTRLGPGEVGAAWLDAEAGRVLVNARRQDGWTGPLVLVEEDEGIADPDLAINLNGLVEATDDVEMAVVYSVGADAPFPVRFAATPRVEAR